MISSHQFKQRFFSSLIGFFLIFCSIAFSYIFPLFFILTIAAIILFALFEYYEIAKNKGFAPQTILGCFFSFAYFISLYFSSFSSISALILLLFLGVSFLSFFHDYTSCIPNLAVTLFGIIYLTLPLGCAILINYFPFSHEQDGRLWLAFTLIVTKMSDVGAYCCGKTFGRIPLASKISPKKTVEGAIGGLIVALASSLLFALYSIKSTDFHLTLWDSVWLGILLSVLAQFGDLAESILKRDAGVKDSSRLPGLGGALDIVDSLVFTLPLMYLILKMNILG